MNNVAGVADFFFSLLQHVAPAGAEIFIYFLFYFFLSPSLPGPTDDGADPDFRREQRSTSRSRRKLLAGWGKRRLTGQGHPPHAQRAGRPVRSSKHRASTSSRPKTWAGVASSPDINLRMCHERHTTNVKKKEKKTPQLSQTSPNRFSVVMATV